VSNEVYADEYRGRELLTCEVGDVVVGYRLASGSGSLAVQCVVTGCVPKPGVDDLWDAAVKVETCVSV
jgi:hypothetical protein